MVYGHMVKSVSGKLMAVVTNGSTSMGLGEYARRAERLGTPPILDVRESIGAYDITFSTNDNNLDIENRDPYVREEIITFSREDALILSRKIAEYFGEVM